MPDPRAAGEIGGCPLSSHGLAHPVEVGATDSHAEVEANIEELVQEFIAEKQAQGAIIGNLFDLMFNSPLLQNVPWAARVFIVAAAEIPIGTHFPQNLP